MPDSDQHGLDSNLQLIAWLEVLTRANPWLAVFILFTRGRFGLDTAIQLQGIYYLSVVVFELPSGWMSDRFGRVLTLRLAASAWVVSFSCFTLGDDRFAVIVAGQILLALGYASLSGTDVTFHHDPLEALGRQGEYADRQGVVASRGLIAAAAAAIAGGTAGLVDLRGAFLLSVLLAFAQLSITLRLTEPPQLTHADAFYTQTRRCLSYLRHTPTAWIFGYGVAMVVLEHVAFTGFQPWVTEAMGRDPNELGAAPIVAGLTVAVTSLVGAAFARTAAPLGRRLGIRLALVVLGAVSATIVTVMSASASLFVLVLVAFRSAQGSAAPVLISAAVAPVVAQRHRATFLSLDSLAGRLSYGCLLLVVSVDAGGDVGRILRPFTTVAWVLVAATFVTAVLVRRRYGRADFGGV